MSTSVYVWPNHRNPITILAHPGHASMECKGKIVNLYISWWPPKMWTDTTAEDALNRDNGVRVYTPTSLLHDAHNEMGERSRNNLASGDARPRAGQEVIKVSNETTFEISGRLVKFAMRNNQFRRLSVAAGSPNVNEIDVWVQMPTRTIEIPDYDSGYDDDWPVNVPKGIGLNPYLIRYWWNGFSCMNGMEGVAGMPARNNDYNFFSRKLNCASVVGHALDFGGAI